MIYKLFLLFCLTIAVTFGQSAQDLNNRFMLAQSYEQAGDLVKSAAILEELIAKQASNYQFFDALNRVYTALKEYDKAAALISERLEKNNNDLNLWGMLGSLYHEKGDEQKAFDTWDRALTVLPRNQVNYKVMANFALQRRAFEKALEYLTAGKKISNDPKLFGYDLGNIYSLTMQYKEAAMEYLDIVKSDAGQLRTVESRIMQYINKTGALQAAIQVFEQNMEERNLSLVYMLAKLYMEAGDYESAFNLYLKIDEKHQNQGTELFNFAQTAFNNNKYETAAKAFTVLAERYPSSNLIPASKLGYAKTVEAALSAEYEEQRPGWKTYHKPVILPEEKVTRAAEAYSEIIELYPHTEQAYEAYLQLGQIKLFLRNDLSAAEQYFKIIVNEAPLSGFYAAALIGLGGIELIKKNVEKAEEYFNLTEKSKRIPPELQNEAALISAKILFSRGKFEPAREKLSAITKDLKDNTANDAIELSLLMNTMMNDSSKLVEYAGAELLAEGRHFEEASHIYKNIAGDKKSLILAAVAQIRAAEMMIALDNYTEAAGLLEKASVAEDGNIYSDKALYLLAKIYHYGTKESDKAVQYYNKLLADYPSSLYLEEAREAILELRKNN